MGSNPARGARHPIYGGKKRKTPISGGIGVSICLCEWQVGQWRWRYWRDWRKTVTVCSFVDVMVILGRMDDVTLCFMAGGQLAGRLT